MESQIPPVKGLSLKNQETNETFSPTSACHDFVDFDEAVGRGILTRQEASKHLEIPPDSPQESGTDHLRLELDYRRSDRFSLQKQSAMKDLNPDLLKRQAPFKCTRKIVKGASLLNVTELHKYDVVKTKDPTANKSKKVARSSLKEDGDGDVWVEKIYYAKKDRRPVTVFVSKKTGNLAKGEPPSGASKVIFLKQSIR
mmetsp:Transcript_19030/g.23978  ORF Transcript_19030/g.23978 Transcript_19030/m.23978 type:complete len:198 (-) Transcript_19030:743-1336(-)